MAAHAIDYVRVRTPTGTLNRNLPEVEAAVHRRGEEGFRLQAAVPETDNGDTVAILLLFVADEA